MRHKIIVTLYDNVEMLEIKSESGTLYPVLIWDDAGAVLIDTGLPGQLELFRSAVERTGMVFERVKTVILTHHDMDHIGSAKLLRGHGAEIMAHELEAPYIQGDALSPKLVAMENRYNGLSEGERTFLERVKAGAPLFHVHVDRNLADNETLPYCGGIKVIHTPGHTPGHITLHLMESDILIAGDAANIENGNLCGANPQHTIDMVKASESFERIKSIGAKGVICYHGGYITGYLK